MADLFTDVLALPVYTSMARQASNYSDDSFFSICTI